MDVPPILPKDPNNSPGGGSEPWHDSAGNIESSGNSTSQPMYPSLNHLGWIFLLIGLAVMLLNGFASTQSAKSISHDREGIINELKSDLQTDPFAEQKSTQTQIASLAPLASDPNEAKLRAGIDILSGKQVDKITLSLLEKGDKSERAAYKLLTVEGASMAKRLEWTKELNPTNVAEAAIARHSFQPNERINPQVKAILQPYFHAVPQYVMVILGGFTLIGVVLGLIVIACYFVFPRLEGHPVLLKSRIDCQSMGVRFGHLVLIFIVVSGIIGLNAAQLHISQANKASMDLVASGIAEIAIVIVTLFAIQRKLNGRSVVEVYGLSWSNFKRTAIYGVVGYPVAMLGVVSFGLLMNLISTAKGPEHPLLQELGSQSVKGGVAALVLVTVAIMAPIYEEILFRGTLMPIIEWTLQNIKASRQWIFAFFLAIIFIITANPASFMNVVFQVVAIVLGYLLFSNGIVKEKMSETHCIIGAILISSLIFGAIHPTGSQSWLPLASIGAINGYLVYRYRSLWPAIVLHGCYNLGSTILALLLSRAA